MRKRSCQLDVIPFLLARRVWAVAVRAGDAISRASLLDVMCFSAAISACEKGAGSASACGVMF
eukprot:3480504-Karenia_brevis.AAC.1